MSDYTIAINDEAVTVNLDIDLTRSFDMSDLTDRIDELRGELEDWHDEQDTTLSFEYALQDADNFAPLADEFNEWSALCEIAAELEGEGGDHEWEGDWYPGEVIHVSDFEQRMDDMMEDCYHEKYKNLPSFISITLDYDALKQDYSEHTFEGNTFLVR